MTDYSVDELNILINQWIRGRNAARNREIFRKSFIDGATQEKIAEEYDLSVRQIQNIIYACQRQLFKHLR